MALKFLHIFPITEYFYVIIFGYSNVYSIFAAERAPVIKLDKNAFEGDSGKPYIVEIPYESEYTYYIN